MGDHGDRLLEHILAGGNDSAANALLNEFFRGYPIARLRLLLQSKDENAFKAGAWIASELGRSIGPLVRELPQLLDHPSRYVRFFVLDAILAGATDEHGEAVARAVLSIRDPDEAIRWKALRILARATKDQLAGSMPYLDDSSVPTLLTWLLSLRDTKMDAQDIVTRLDNRDPLIRMFAVAAAARFNRYDLIPLERAAASMDPVVNSFAKEEIESFKDNTV